MIKQSANVTKVSWSHLKARVSAKNPELAKLLDRFHHKKKYPLILARYPFGSHIVDQGTFLLPGAKGKVVPLDHPDISSEIKKLLNYCSIPFFIWLNTTGEVYVDIDARRIPLNVFDVGSFCGLWEALDDKRSDLFSKRIWNVAPGARTIFTLPKITDAVGFKRIEKKFNLRASRLPKNIFEQINLFCELIAHHDHVEPWTCEILLFPYQWFKEDTSSEWVALMYHLLKKEWQQSLYWRNKVTLDLMGQLFSSTQASQNLRPSAYLIDTIMYLIAIGVSASPGFSPIPSNDQVSAPTNVITHSLLEDYGLKTYFPTLMRPSFLTPGSCVYYSMQVPTMLGSSCSIGRPHSVLEDMRTVKKLLEVLREALEKSNSPIFNLIRNIRFEFFHSEEDKHHQIMASHTMPKDDSRLMGLGSKTRIFCDTSSFVRGCVRIKSLL